jgi:hypothetical protein
MNCVAARERVEARLGEGRELVLAVAVHEGIVKQKNESQSWSGS